MELTITLKGKDKGEKVALFKSSGGNVMGSRAQALQLVHGSSGTGVR